MANDKQNKIADLRRKKLLAIVRKSPWTSMDFLLERLDCTLNQIKGDLEKLRLDKLLEVSFVKDVRYLADGNHESYKRTIVRIPENLNVNEIVPKYILDEMDNYRRKIRGKQMLL